MKIVDPTCPACRAADRLQSPELSMVVGIAWGVWLAGGYPPQIAAHRTRELLCQEHADQVVATALMMKENSLAKENDPPKTPTQAS